MPTTAPRRLSAESRANRVTPSIVDPAVAAPFTLEQELEVFGAWVGEPIWTPPMESSRPMAETMLRRTGWFASEEARWEAVVDHHREEFTQVREIELPRASIRLPQGRFFVSVTEQKDFDKIAEKVPACVQTRLEEFLEGKGKRWGVKVYYLKPLCVELGDELILTTRKDLTNAVKRIRSEVFEEYHALALAWRIRDAAVGVADAALAVPRRVVKWALRRRQKAIDAYRARLEFERRKTALGAARAYRKCRTDGCSFDEMLALTNPLKEEAVIEQFGVENELSRAKRDQLIRLAAGSAPWFVTLSLAAAQVASAAAYVMAGTASVATCDPVFVAEFPERPGELLKIGHFDEVGGVMHIEI